MFENSKILDPFYKIVFDSIDKKGVFPHNAIVRTIEEKTELYALAVEEPSQAAYFLKSIFKKGGIIELVFGFDRYVLPGQGEFQDLVSVHYWDGQTWHIGVIEYKYISPTEKIVRPINWNHPYWTERLLQETTDYFGKGEPNGNIN